jgi:hypothetical protein
MGAARYIRKLDLEALHTVNSRLSHLSPHLKHYPACRQRFAVSNGLVGSLSVDTTATSLRFGA